MNKWQIICPVAALLVAGMVAGIIVVRDQHRGVIIAASRSLGSDLVAATNSSRLVRLSPHLRAQLGELLASPTRVSSVLAGDVPPPAGDGSACSRVILTNAAGRQLLIRLRDEGAGRFEVVGFRNLAEEGGVARHELPD
jgi:hypothetical protein